ncbi:hypothetical protein GW796_09555 [archaeon]|nr:hypothetical protein [archaeon]
MGTRGALGFRSGRKDKVTYNHFDSYPDGLGNSVLTFIKGETLESLKKTASNIVLVNSEDIPSAEQVKECDKWTNVGVGNQSTEDWYCVLRKSQGDLLSYSNGLKYMIDSSSFLLDSLFCEYAYIINTDSNMLEFYVGFNKLQLNGKGRYANKKAISDQDNGYFGVALVGKYRLADIIGATDSLIDAIVKSMDKKASSFSKRQSKKLGEPIYD